MLPKTTQSGFSAVEAILVIVIVGIIGGTGWFVWHSKQVADKTLSTVSKDNLSVRQISNKPFNFTFKELGVSFTPPGVLQGLKYSNVTMTNVEGKNITSVDLILENDPNLPKGCQINNTFIAYPKRFMGLSRVEGTYDAMNPFDGGSGLLKQFDGFHFDIGVGNGAPCPTASKEDEIRLETNIKAKQNAFINSFKQTATVTQN